MFGMIFTLLSNVFFVSYVRSQSFSMPLSAKEEAKYLQLHFQGDKNARDILIERNLRLVAHVAKKYENNKDLQEDIISIGTIGLIKAVDNFKEDHKTKLATFAARCIDNEILMHLRTNKKTSLDISLSESIGSDKDGGEMVLEDIIPCDQEEFIDIINKQDNLNKIEKFFPVLTSRERKILIMRYGLFNTDKMTQKEIAKSMKISRSYVSRVEKRALIKLLKEFVKEEENTKGS